VNGAIVITRNLSQRQCGLGISGLQLISSAAFPASPHLAAALQGGSARALMDFPAQLPAPVSHRSWPGSWINEPTPPVATGNQVTVHLQATGPARFFRLVLSP